MGRTTYALKVLARSRSVAFTRDCVGGNGTGERRYTWHGTPVAYRTGTSDTELIYKILLKRGAKSEYCPPREFRLARNEVRMVLDIGANIGISSLYFASIFPNAEIHAFEPEPGNFDVLKSNASTSPRIHCHLFALGAADGNLTLYDSDVPSNRGGFSAYSAGINPARNRVVPVRRPDSALRELGIDAIDVIKIDTEGAEWDILTSFDPDLLRGVQLIMGELHGNRDFALLDYLQPGFDIGMRKDIRNRLFNFYAVRREPPRSAAP